MPFGKVNYDCLLTVRVIEGNVTVIVYRGEIKVTQKLLLDVPRHINGLAKRHFSMVV